MTAKPIEAADIGSILMQKHADSKDGGFPESGQETNELLVDSSGPTVLLRNFISNPVQKVG